MTFDGDLKDLMKRTAADSPDPCAMLATIQKATTRRQRRMQLAMVVGVAAAVTTIVLGATAIRHSASPSEVPVAAAPITPGPIASTVGPESALTTTVNPALVGSSARCYATADVGRSDNYFSITIGGDGSNPVAAGPLALELCSKSWRGGTLSTDPPYKIDNPAEKANLPIPKLVACILPADNSDEGVEEVAILPGSAKTCENLGLSAFSG
ncbi:MAG: hypothetical protein ABI382_09880 [Nakamurella sp.]